MFAASTTSTSPSATGSRQATRSSLTLIEKSARVEDPLQVEIAVLKDPTPYKVQFSVQTIQELSQAIDIVAKLQVAAYRDASRVGYGKLKRAKFHLEDLLLHSLEVS